MKEVSKWRAVMQASGIWSCMAAAALAVLLRLPLKAMPPAPQNDGAGQSISITSRLVTLPVRVTDSHGDFVSGLTRENFRVYEDGRLLNFSLFQQEDAPVTVGLIVDHSGSMRSKLPGVITAVSAFARSSNPQDEMFVVDFNDSVSTELLGGRAFTSESNELARAVGLVEARGRTALYDAVVEGLDHVQLGHWEKKALVVISDGGDNVSKHKLSQVLEMAARSQAMVYGVGLLGEAGEEENPQVIERLSKETGGIAFFAGPKDSVADVMAKVARDLREQYTIGYVPANGGGKTFRKIEVRVSGSGRGRMHVRTRPGYSVADREESALRSKRSTP